MFNKLCRACLTTKESFSYFLFENVSPDIYWFCTSVEIHEGEELPKALCNSCFELLTTYSDFKRTCIKSQNTLLNCNKNGTEQCQNQTEADSLLEAEVQLILNTVNDSKPGLVKQEAVLDTYSDDHPLASESPDLSVHGDPIPIVKVSKRKKLSKLKRRPKKVVSSKKYFLYSCELCSRRFRYSERFDAHKLEHEGQRVSLHCLPCNKTFLTWGGLKRHKESSHTAGSLERLACGACGRVCKSRDTLRAHQRGHGVRSGHVCHVCGKRVSTAVLLSAHLETHKADRERPHTCEHCGKKFFTNATLLSHISRLHTGRRFICHYCHYPFTDKYNLSKHLLIHEGKKLYKCNICEKSYSTNNSLAEHTRIHSGERPYGCSYCVKTFISKRRLLDHHRIHTGEKPHKCRVCEQRFTQRGTLQRHMKVHDKVLPAIN